MLQLPNLVWHPYHSGLFQIPAHLPLFFWSVCLSSCLYPISYLKNSTNCTQIPRFSSGRLLPSPLRKMSWTISHFSLTTDLPPGWALAYGFFVLLPLALLSSVLSRRGRSTHSWFRTREGRMASVLPTCLFTRVPVTGFSAATSPCHDFDLVFTASCPLLLTRLCRMLFPLTTESWSGWCCRFISVSGNNCGWGLRSRFTALVGLRFSVS